MLKHLLVISAVFLGCCHQQGLSAALEEDSDSARSMCAWNGEGCKNDDETNEYSEHNDDKGVDGWIDVMSGRNSEKETERSSDWIEHVLDEMMEDGNSHGMWKNLIGSWSDRGASWTGSITGSWHYGPARLWTTPVNSDQYTITSRVQVLNRKACGHLFKYKNGSVATSSSVTKAWGYFLWDGYMYITSSGPESSPRITFPVTSDDWYNLTSEINGTHVKIFVNDKLAQEITMLGTGADAKSSNYVGLWCHRNIPVKGDSFKLKGVSDVNECHNNLCQNGATCTNTIRGYNCTCAQGFQGRLCDQDINECDNEPCQNGATCIDNIGSYQCVCAKGFEGKNCTKDINECDNNPCQNGGTCIDNIGNYQCVCAKGFEGKNCTKDIDECSVSNNGGCSHKCVNTAGGYKCECQDPELSLSSDNKTCHAPGVNVLCNSQSMTIIIPKSLLRGIDREHLRLLDTTCKATETSSHFSLTTPLIGCNTSSRHTPTAIIYSNAVLEIPVAVKDVVTRVREIEIQFSCFYSEYGVVSSVGSKPSDRKLVFSDEGRGNFTLLLNMFPDNRFVSPYMKGDFPVAVVLRKRLFFEVSVVSNDKQLSIRADHCYATPTQDKMNLLKYDFFKNGCPSDVTVKYHAAPSLNAQRFSLEAFKFIADHPFVFVHCHVVICNATDPSSQCVKTCPSSGRGRREVSGHMTDDVYSLSQGPLHLTRKKRENKLDRTLDNSDSSPTIVMALFLMCVACFGVTALMAFNKSRDKPNGYTVLANGDQI